MKGSRIDTVIVGGGNIQKDFALDFLKKTEKKAEPEGLHLIAADRGLEFFMETGLVPEVIVGDFDSLSPGGRRYLESLENVEISRLKPEKDDSDTQSAVNLAIQRGAKEIAVLGATGNRFDHLMANLGLLSLGKKLGVRILLADAWNCAALVESGTKLEQSSQFGKYVSFFPVGGDVEGLTLEGFKYPLFGHHLTAADSGLTVSNEITQAVARVTFTRGTLLMIMARD